MLVDPTQIKEIATSEQVDSVEIPGLGLNEKGKVMRVGGVRVGMFAMSLKNIAGDMSVDGTIYVGANNPYKYHEAFHSVYRLLLTDQEIIRYRSIARKDVRAKLREEGKSFKTELERFRNSADTYLNLSQTQLEDRYYEEYLADEFLKVLVLKELFLY